MCAGAFLATSKYRSPLFSSVLSKFFAIFVILITAWEDAEGCDLPLAFELFNTKSFLIAGTHVSRYIPETKLTQSTGSMLGDHLMMGLSLPRLIQ